MDYAGIDGFLGTRASLMLDVVFLAMFAVVPLLGWNIYQARYRRRYNLHKWAQLTVGMVLLVAVALFEADMQVNGWKHRTVTSLGEPTPAVVYYALYVHLIFAITTPLLWIYVIVLALRKFPNPPAPNEHSRHHAFWGRLAAIDLVCTAVTGWVFYWLAFVA